MRVAPEIPPLSAEIASDCPDPPKIASDDVAALITADAELAILYRQCQIKHRAGVAAYEAVRRGMGKR